MSEARTHRLVLSAPMARAALAGLKSVTRRIERPQPQAGTAGAVWGRPEGGRPTWAPVGADGRALGEPRPARFAAGDEIAFGEALVRGPDGLAYYAADELEVLVDGAPLTWRWRVATLPGRFCPVGAVRIRWRLASARLECVGDITHDDARREGLPDDYELASEVFGGAPLGLDKAGWDGWLPRQRFAALWDGLHGRPRKTNGGQALVCAPFGAGVCGLHNACPLDRPDIMCRPGPDPWVWRLELARRTEPEGGAA